MTSTVKAKMLIAQCSDNNVFQTAKNVMINPMENEPKTQIEDQEKKTLCRRVKSYFFLHPRLKGRRARWTWFCFQIETKKDMEGGGRANVRSTYATLRLTHPNLPVELRDFQVVGWTLDYLS